MTQTEYQQAVAMARQILGEAPTQVGLDDIRLLCRQFLRSYGTILKYRDVVHKVKHLVEIGDRIGASRLLAEVLK